MRQKITYDFASIHYLIGMIPFQDLCELSPAATDTLDDLKTLSSMFAFSLSDCAKNFETSRDRHYAWFINVGF